MCGFATHGFIQQAAVKYGTVTSVATFKMLATLKEQHSPKMLSWCGD